MVSIIPNTWQTLSLVNWNVMQKLVDISLVNGVTLSVH